MKKCLTPLIIREMQMKTMLQYHFILVRMNFFSERLDITSVNIKDMEKRKEFWYILGGYVNYSATMENGLDAFKEKKTKQHGPGR